MAAHITFGSRQECPVAARPLFVTHGRHTHDPCGNAISSGAGLLAGWPHVWAGRHPSIPRAHPRAPPPSGGLLSGYLQDEDTHAWGNASLGTWHAVLGRYSCRGFPVAAAQRSLAWDEHGGAKNVKLPTTNTAPPLYPNEPSKKARMEQPRASWRTDGREGGCWGKEGRKEGEKEGEKGRREARRKGRQEGKKEGKTEGKKKERGS